MKHTPGPWVYEPETVNDEVIAFSIDGGGRYLADVHVHTTDKDNTLTEANARLVAAAPEMLDELKKAHLIIRNALNIMTVEQKRIWSEANERDDLKDGWAVTRADARERVIAKATTDASE